ncbi:MAG: sigma-70 family RNA polymerase sigma factor [Deltaproteobacteria bacterium]|nr:sigma-70 family RNA polymerase sigma factor [Deltaproteobacteria bacterium]
MQRSGSEKDNERDMQWVRDFKAGDRSAFDKIMLKHKDRVFSLCYRFLGDFQEANDSAQETFVKVFTSLKRFRAESSFSTWLYRIAANTCKNRLKSSPFKHRKRMVPLHDPVNGKSNNPGANIRDEGPTPNGALLAKEKMMLIQEGIDSLPEGQKSVIILRDVEGLSYDEVSTITGYPLGTVKSKLARARLALRDRLRGVI